MAAIKKISKKFFIKWQQACYVCFPMMVQGDLSALTLSHWYKANYTGILAGLGAVIMHYSYFKLFEQKKWFHGLQIAIATFFADLYIHPSHFGGQIGEAVLTALAAGLLATYFAYKPLVINNEKVS